MTGRDIAQECDKIWNVLTNHPDYEEAFTILAIVTDRFLGLDDTDENRDYFIQWLQWARDQKESKAICEAIH